MGFGRRDSQCMKTTAMTRSHAGSKLEGLKTN